jgi:hypothetical protein
VNRLLLLQKIFVFFMASVCAVVFAQEIYLPQTGQTTCYDEGGTEINCTGTGQDGDKLAGIKWPSTRFVDNGDGTITDNLTGLMWLKDAICILGLREWAEALTAVADFNNNPGNYSCGYYTANYTDWVLPNINELESLVNAEEADSSIWLNSQGFTNVQSFYYWSASTCAHDTSRAWLVYMPCGSVSYDAKYCNSYVWPVRSGQ